MLPHHGVGPACVHLYQLGGKLPGYHLAAFDPDIEPAVPDILRMASGIDQADTVLLDGQRPVVVRADEEIHPSETLEQVTSLALVHCPVAVTRAGMHCHYDRMRMLLCNHLVHVLLHYRNQGLELDAGPETFVEPCADVRIGVSENSHLEPVLLQDCGDREIPPAFLTGLESIASEERNPLGIQLPGNPVIHRMTGLDIVIADRNRLVAHIGDEAGEQVRGEGVYIIVIICRIVPLEAVPGIDQKHIVLTERVAELRHVRIDRHQGGLHRAANISRVEPASVYVIGRQEVELVFPVLRTVRAC